MPDVKPRPPEEPVDSVAPLSGHREGVEAVAPLTTSDAAWCDCCHGRGFHGYGVPCAACDATGHSAPTGKPKASDARCSICRGGGLIGKDGGYFATCATCGGSGRPIDPRPLCVSCGKPWVPPEGVDATAEECGPCRYRRHGQPVPPEKSCRVCEYNGSCVRHPLAQPAAAQGERDDDPNGHDCRRCGHWVYGDGEELCSECKACWHSHEYQSTDSKGAKYCTVCETAKLQAALSPQPPAKDRSALGGKLLPTDPEDERVIDGLMAKAMADRKVTPMQAAKERGEVGQGLFPVERPTVDVLLRFAKDLDKQGIATCHQGPPLYLAKLRGIVAMAIEHRALQSTLAERDREVEAFSFELEAVKMMREELQGLYDQASGQLTERDRGVERLRYALEEANGERSHAEDCARQTRGAAEKAEQRVRELEVERDILQAERDDEHRQRIHWQQRHEKADAELSSRAKSFAELLQIHEALMLYKDVDGSYYDAVCKLDRFREDLALELDHEYERAEKAEAERDKREVQLKAEVKLTKELRYELGQAEEAPSRSPPPPRAKTP